MKESEEYVKNNPGKTPEEYFEAGFDMCMDAISDMVKINGGSITLVGKGFEKKDNQ